MKRFEVPPSMETFADTDPLGDDLLKVAEEGGPEARDALARTWITEGIPLAFRECPAVYDSMRVWLGDVLKVHPKLIGLTGSARFGSSFVASKVGRPFRPGSDLDIFVVSQTLFARYRADFVAWRNDFHSGVERPRSDRERRWWLDNAERVPRNISRGFIDVRFIPARTRYKAAQHTLDTMSNLVRKLAATPRSPSPPRATVRCYESWGALVRQVSLSLQRSGRSFGRLQHRRRTDGR